MKKLLCVAGMLATVLLMVSAGMAAEYKTGKFKCQKGKRNDWHGYFACIPDNVCPDMRIRIDGKLAYCNVKNAKEVLAAKFNSKEGYKLDSLPPFVEEGTFENLGMIGDLSDYPLHSYYYYKLVSDSNEVVGYFVDHYYKAFPSPFRVPSTLSVRLVTRYNAEGKLAAILMKCGGRCPDSLY